MQPYIISNEWDPPHMNLESTMSGITYNPKLTVCITLT